MTPAKTIRLAIGLALTGLIGCTDAQHNAPAEEGRRPTTADSIILDKLWEDSLKPAMDQDDVPALKRITAHMLRSPYVRNRLPDLMSTLEWRTYSMGRSGAREQYAAELDSMLSDARVREDTTMLFALLNVRAMMTMNSERDLAKALVFREQALRPMSLS